MTPVFARFWSVVVLHRRCALSLVVGLRTKMKVLNYRYINARLVNGIHKGGDFCTLTDRPTNDSEEGQDFLR